MHAVLVRVTINDPESSVRHLQEQTVPRVSGAPGFVTGTWTRVGNDGLSLVVFESEEAARKMAEIVADVVPEGVTLEDVQVREVAAHV